MSVKSAVKAAGKTGEGESIRESSDITFERYLEIKIENESPDETMSVPYSPLNEGKIHFSIIHAKIFSRRWEVPTCAPQLSSSTSRRRFLCPSN